MSAEGIIKSAVEEIPKAVAAGIVDMTSGMLLAVKTVESHPQEILDMVAAATRELYEGDMVTQIENMFKASRGVTSEEHYFQEFLISSTNLWHYFGRLKSNPSVVLTVVARGDANLGMLSMKARNLVNTGSI